MIVEDSIFIHADIKKVWDIFTDLTCWQHWNSVLKNVSDRDTTTLEKGQKFACRIRPFILPVFFEPQIEEVIPYERVVWTAKKYGINAMHEFVFSKTENKIKVISREEFSGIPVSLYPLLFPATKIKELTTALLQDLKEAAESSVNKFG